MLSDGRIEPPIGAENDGNKEGSLNMVVVGKIGDGWDDFVDE